MQCEYFHIDSAAKSQQIQRKFEANATEVEAHSYFEICRFKLCNLYFLLFSASVFVLHEKQHVLGLQTAWIHLPGPRAVTLLDGSKALWLCSTPPPCLPPSPVTHPDQSSQLRYQHPAAEKSHNTAEPPNPRCSLGSNAPSPPLLSLPTPAATFHGAHFHLLSQQKTIHLFFRAGFFPAGLANHISSTQGPASAVCRFTPLSTAPAHFQGRKPGSAGVRLPCAHIRQIREWMLLKTD